MRLHGGSQISVPDPQAPWAGNLDWQRSGTYALALCSGGEELVRRERRHIRSDPRGTYELLVPIAGTAWVEQGSSSGDIDPGAMVLCGRIVEAGGGVEGTPLDRGQVFAGEQILKLVCPA